MKQNITWISKKIFWPIKIMLIVIMHYTEMAKHSIKHVNSPFYIQTLFQTIHYILFKIHRLIWWMKNKHKCNKWSSIFNVGWSLNMSFFQVSICRFFKLVYTDVCQFYSYKYVRYMTCVYKPACLIVTYITCMAYLSLTKGHQPYIEKNHTNIIWLTNDPYL